MHTVHDLDRPDSVMEVLIARNMALPADWSVAVLPGRVIHVDGQGICLVDTARSRLHPASVAGLVVATMGAFVFALYLRRWLGERKPVRAPAAVEEGDG